MPIEFKQTAMLQGSTDNELYKLEMKYDGSGRRISKTVWRKAVGAENWQKNQVTHYTGIGTEIRENYHNESLDKAKVVMNMPQGLGRYGIEDAKSPDMGFGAGYIPNVKFEWYLKNHLGSTMLVYGTEGNATSDPFRVSAPLATYDYRAFGEMVTLSQPSDRVIENFTGKERDDETKLNYFGARYLDPMLGMWISVDPKRQFASPYLYAGNGMNPVNENDEDGNAMKPAPLAVGSGIWWGWVSCYQVQNAYFTRGGDSYLTAVGLGLAAYGLTVAATVLGIDSQNILATTLSSGLVNMVVSGGQNAAVQYFATGTVDKNELITEVAKGGISGMIGGAVSYGLSEHWAGHLEWSNGERLYPESGAAAGFVGQAVSTGFSNIVEMKNPDTKTEPVEVEK